MSPASASAAQVSDARQRAQGFAALIAVQLFFGLFPLFGKVALAPGAFGPRSVCAWRIAFGAAVMLAIAFAIHGREAWPPRRDWGRLVLCSILGVVANMWLFLEGLSRSTATNTALLLPLIPVFTAVAAIVLREERFERVRALGMTVAFAGASLVLFQKGPELSSEHLVGNLLVVTNEICYAFYLVLARRLVETRPPIAVTAWVFALSAWAVPVLLHGDAEAVPAAAGPKAWVAIAYIVVFPTVFAYLFNVFALSRVSASTAATFIFLQPLITVAGGMVILGEPLPDHALLATLLTFGGVWIVTRRRAPRPEPGNEARGTSSPSR
jgi:drug/metabolite transporter (DMT)-like permease